MKNKIYNIVILVSVIFFFLPVIVNNHTFYAFDTLTNYFPWKSTRPVNNTLITDPVNVFYPIHYSNKKNFEHSFIPHWDNSTFCGKPVGCYSSPIQMLFYKFLPISTAHNSLLFLHLLFIGIFSYYYLLEIKRSKIASIVGSLSWMFNGYVMVWFEFENVVMIATTLPLLLLTYERFKKNQTFETFLHLLFGMAFPISTGFVHVLIYQYLFFGSYALFNEYNVYLQNKNLNSFAKKKGILSVIFIFACLINLSMIKENLSTYSGSQRSEVTHKDLFDRTGQILPKYLFTLVFPDLFGSPTAKFSCVPKNKEMQIYNNYNELCIYTGIVVFILAIISIFGRKCSLYWFYLVSAFITISMAMSPIVYYPFAKFVPGLNISTPTRVIYLFGFSMTILSAYGIDAIINKSINKKLFYFILGLISFLTFCFYIYFSSNHGIEWIINNKLTSFSESSQNFIHEYYSTFSPVLFYQFLVVLLTVIIIVFAYNNNRKIFILHFLIFIIIIDLFVFGKLYNTTSPKNNIFPVTSGINYLKSQNNKFRVMSFDNFLHNGLVTFDIEDIGGYSSFYDKRYGDFIHMSQTGNIPDKNQKYSRWLNFRAFGSPLLNLINTKFLLLPPNIKVDNEQLKLVYNKEISIYKNLNCFERAFYVPEYDYCENIDTLKAKLISYSLDDFKQKVLLEAKPKNMNNNLVLNPIADVFIKKYTTNGIRIISESNESGFVVLSDTYHPDWQVYVNGKKEKMYRANYIMRAVHVKKGKNIIVFRYENTFKNITYIFSLILWSLLTIMLIYLCLRKRKAIF